MGYLLKCITYNFLAQWIIAAVSEVAAGFCSQKEFKNSYVADDPLSTLHLQFLMPLSSVQLSI